MALLTQNSLELSEFLQLSAVSCQHGLEFFDRG